MHGEISVKFNNIYLQQVLIKVVKTYLNWFHFISLFHACFFKQELYRRQKRNLSNTPRFLVRGCIENLVFNPFILLVTYCLILLNFSKRLRL